MRKKINSHIKLADDGSCLIPVFVDSTEEALERVKEIEYEMNRNFRFILFKEKQSLEYFIREKEC